MEELIERIKHMPLKARLVVALALGIVLPLYFVFMDEVEAVDWELEDARTQYESIEIKYNKAKRQKNDMPELEKKHEFTQKQLAEAKKRLPDVYHMDSILEFVAKSSDESGVKLLEFTPNDEEFKDTGYSYVEMPINLGVEGSYNQIGVFFDKLVHMEKMVHIRDLNAQQIQKQQDDPTGIELTKEAKLAQILDGVKVKATAKLVVFRSARPGEGAAPAAE
jgi:type IV pilus assembly protein PilO